MIELKKPIAFLFFLAIFLLPGRPSFAAPGGGKTTLPEEEDFSGTPYTDYGEFNQTQDEDADVNFFQNGRFFGVSLGLGTQLVTGNRGSLWQGGFPSFDFKLHYWFDFNIALDLQILTAQQYYDTTVTNLGHVDINMLHVGMDVKYYFNTKNLSAPLTYASPYLLGGFGSYTKTQNSNTQQTQDQDASVGLCLGAGLEFPIFAKKSYFSLEGKMHIVTFKDTFTTLYSDIGLRDLTGNFVTVTANVLFTW